MNADEAARREELARLLESSAPRRKAEAVVLADAMIAQGWTKLPPPQDGTALRAANPELKANEEKVRSALKHGVWWDELTGDDIADLLDDRAALLAHTAALTKERDDARREAFTFKRAFDLKSHVVERFLPCPDCRDKVVPGECERCKRQAAEAKAAALRAERDYFQAQWNACNEGLIEFAKAAESKAAALAAERDAMRKALLAGIAEAERQDNNPEDPTEFSGDVVEQMRAALRQGGSDA